VIPPPRVWIPGRRRVPRRRELPALILTGLFVGWVDLVVRPKQIFPICLDRPPLPAIAVVDKPDRERPAIAIPRPSVIGSGVVRCIRAFEADGDLAENLAIAREAEMHGDLHAVVRLFERR